MKKYKQVICGIVFGIGLSTLLKYPNYAFSRIINNEKLDLKDDILDDAIKLYYENKISSYNNINMAIGYFTRMLESGSLSMDNFYKYDDSAELYDYYNNNSYDCIIGKGVCRSESNLISSLLNKCGFNTSILTNWTSNNLGHSYILIFDDENNKKYIYDFTNKCYWKFNSLHETVPVKNNADFKSTPYIFASLSSYIDFGYDDLYRVLSYDNDVDFDKIYSDFKSGLFACKDHDLSTVKVLTYNEKEKIKKIEQK